MSIRTFVIMLGVAVLAGSVSAYTYFSDNFNDGNADGWTASGEMPSLWSVVDGKYWYNNLAYAAAYSTPDTHVLPSPVGTGWALDMDINIKAYAGSGCEVGIMLMTNDVPFGCIVMREGLVGGTNGVNLYIGIGGDQYEAAPFVAAPTNGTYHWRLDHLDGQNQFYVTLTGNGVAQSLTCTTYNSEIVRKADNFKLYVYAAKPAFDNIVVSTMTNSMQLVETGGTFGSKNYARGPGAVAFAKDVINGGGYPAHQINHLNDGIYGNANSWIGASAQTFAGVSFGGSYMIDQIAFGRDNTGGLTDRYSSLYIVWYTTVPNPDANTPDSSWIYLDVLHYEVSPPPSPCLRHRYQLPSPVMATGIRLSSLTSEVCIDEIEVYGRPPCGTTFSFH